MLAALVELLTAQLNVASDKVTSEALLGADLGADSLDTAEIAMQIHEKFGCELTDQDLASIKTVGDLLNSIKRHTSET